MLGTERLLKLTRQGTVRRGASAHAQAIMDAFEVRAFILYVRAFCFTRFLLELPEAASA